MQYYHTKLHVSYEIFMCDICGVKIKFRSCSLSANYDYEATFASFISRPGKTN
jgi:hypothetical protein